MLFSHVAPICGVAPVCGGVVRKAWLFDFHGHGTYFIAAKLDSKIKLDSDSTLFNT